MAENIVENKNREKAAVMAAAPATVRHCQILDCNDNVVHPETDSSVVKVGEKTLDEALNDAAGGIQIIEWKSSSVLTRKSIPFDKRKKGMQISYVSSDGYYVIEQCVGEILTKDDIFSRDTQWVRINTNNDKDNFIGSLAEKTRELSKSDIPTQGYFKRNIDDNGGGANGFVSDYIEGNSFWNYTGSIVDAPTLNSVTDKDICCVVANVYDKDKKYIGWTAQFNYYNPNAHYFKFYCDKNHKDNFSVSVGNFNMLKSSEVSALFDITSKITLLEPHRASLSVDGYYDKRGVFNAGENGFHSSEKLHLKIVKCEVPFRAGASSIVFFDAEEKVIKTLNGTKEGRLTTIDLSDYEYESIAFSAFGNLPVFFYTEENGNVADAALENRNNNYILKKLNLQPISTYNPAGEPSSSNVSYENPNFYMNSFHAPCDIVIESVRVKAEKSDIDIVLSLYNPDPILDVRIPKDIVSIQATYDKMYASYNIGKSTKAGDYTDIVLQNPIYAKKGDLVYIASIGKTYLTTTNQHDVIVNYRKSNEASTVKNKILFDSDIDKRVVSSAGWSVENGTYVPDGDTQENILIFPCSSAIHSFTISAVVDIAPSASFRVGKIDKIFYHTFRELTTYIEFQPKKLIYKTFANGSGKEQSISNLPTGKCIVEIKQSVTDTIQKNVVVNIKNYNSLEILATATFDSSQDGNFDGYLALSNISGISKFYSVMLFANGPFPNLIVYADSIGEGVALSKSDKSYINMMSDEMEKNGKYVGNSTKAGDRVGNVITRLKNELLALKPQYAMFTIGVNGGGSVENYSTIVEMCQECGVIPLINHIMACPLSYCDYNEVNECIDEVVRKYNLIKPALLDVATSKNYELSQGPNYELHPPLEGHERCFERIKNDYPFLF